MTAVGWSLNEQHGKVERISVDYGLKKLVCGDKDRDKVVEIKEGSIPEQKRTELRKNSQWKERG